MSDLFVHGIEIASTRRPVWEDSYQDALAAGHRLFPSFGSDIHHIGTSAFGVGCYNGNPGPARGAAVCWVPENDATRLALTAAMRARNCYASAGYKPVLQFEAWDEPTDPPTPMGSLLAVTDSEATIRITAINDLANQTNGNDNRLERVELVNAADGSVIRSWPCVLDSLNGDSCVVLDTIPNLPDGALYVRVCELEGGSECGLNGALTRLVGAPIFVNWAAYRGSLGIVDDPSCDFDLDGVACYDDNCWVDANPGQEDTDADGVGDACDVCPSTYDPYQEDADGDGFGDACDVCPSIPNLSGNLPGDSDGDTFPDACDVCPGTEDPDQIDTDQDGVGDACDTCPILPNGSNDPIGQIDTDTDGVGDACDNCRDVANARPEDACSNQQDADLDGYGNACDTDIDNDGATSMVDAIAVLDAAQITSTDPLMDFNCDGAVGLDDFYQAFDDAATLEVPGPSDLTCAGQPPCAVVDADLDGVRDYEDNCKWVANGPWNALNDCQQQDSDGDGYGNACDSDFDNDGAAALPDLSLMLDATPHVLAVDHDDPGDPYAALDVDCDGGVTLPDLSRVIDDMNAVSVPGNFFSDPVTVVPPGEVGSGLACADPALIVPGSFPTIVTTSYGTGGPAESPTPGGVRCEP